MLSLTIWRISLVLEAWILFRSFRSKTFRRYPFFYTYIAGVLISQFFLYVAYALNAAYYNNLYWSFEIPTLLLGCGIVLEILKHVLTPYPGAERFARITGLAIFACVFCFASVYPLVRHGRSTGGVVEDYERDLRMVQALFLAGVIGIISYYGIPLGKNLKGMIFGYGLFVATSLANLSLRSYAGMPTHPIWSAIQPFSYDLSLGIWLAALWSYSPNPAPSLSTRPEDDYEMLVVKTRNAMGGMRSYLARTSRP